VNPPSIGFTWRIGEGSIGCGNGQNNASISVFFGGEISQLCESFSEYGKINK
jgi:hypothetical protein